MVCLLAFIALRLLMQEAHLTQENVKGFIIAIFQSFLGHLYHIDVECQGCVMLMVIMVGTVMMNMIMVLMTTTTTKMIMMMMSHDDDWRR
eukprot:5531559-Karenia_brevis.AAC.1